jgi:glyoxylase-like metal-dependent hydrolase (beta-lactamase superfamily II)
VIRGTTDLADPRQAVSLRVHSRAHSQGDLTVYLPQADVLYAGGIVPVGRNPYGADADVRRWIGVLNSLILEPARVVVGIHGRATDIGEREIVDRVLGLRDLGRWYDTARLPEFIAVLAERIVAEGVIERRKRGILPPVSPAEEAPAADDAPSPGSN